MLRGAGLPRWLSRACCSPTPIARRAHRINQQPVCAPMLVQARGSAQAGGTSAHDEDRDFLHLACSERVYNFRGWAVCGSERMGLEWLGWT